MVNSTIDFEIIEREGTNHLVLVRTAMNRHFSRIKKAGDFWTNSSPKPLTSVFKWHKNWAGLCKNEKTEPLCSISQFPDWKLACPSPSNSAASPGVNPSSICPP
jgi:hypothetical protein